MRTTLRVAALLVLLGVGDEWALRGRRGWTQNSVQHTVTDPVTGIEGPVWENKFVPGYDFLAEGAVAAAVLAGTSFVFGRRKKTAG